MLGSTENPNLAEVQIREEIRAELEAESALLLERLGDADRRFTALVITVSACVSVMLPVVALVIGVSWRLFKWSAGL